MNIKTLTALNLTEKLVLLNRDYKETPELIYDQVEDKEDFEGICAECYHQTHQKSAGDEGWTYCPGCETIEGTTYEITVLTDLKVAYNFNTKEWIEADDNIGME